MPSDHPAILDGILVLRWKCSECGHINYTGPKMPDADEAKEFAEDMGCEPDEVAVIPILLACHYCETIHDTTKEA